MSFIPSVSTAVRFAGSAFFAHIGAGVLTPDAYNLISNKTEHKFGVITNALSASLIALSIFGLTPLGIASSGVFAGVALVSLAGKNKNQDDAFYLASSIANLGGGVYSLIALPFSCLNAVATLSLFVSVLVGISINREK